MTKEDIKAILKSYNAVKAEREQLAARLEEIEARLYAPKGTNLDGMPRSSSGVGSPIERAVAQHQDLLALYTSQLAQLDATQLRVETLIAALADPQERALMRCRYLDGLTWEEVCVAVGYSWRQTHNIHARALDKLVELNKEVTP